MQSNQGSNPDQPRHWRGTAGNRHEHHNVWVIGGTPQRYVASRSDTTTSTSPTTGSTGSATSSIENMASTRRDSDISTTSTGNSAFMPNTGERRRSSTSGSTNLFNTLSNQKRSSEDPAMAARRASWTDQAHKGGFLGKWWDSYTRGH